MNPPSWVLISGLLKMMDQKFAMKPSLGEARENLAWLQQHLTYVSTSVDGSNYLSKQSAAGEWIYKGNCRTCVCVLGRCCLVQSAIEA